MSVKAKTSALSLSMLLLACQSNQSVPSKSSAEAGGSSSRADVLAKPPIAKRVDYAVVSEHGTRNDPYYWMRDDERKAPDVIDYLNAENAYTNAFFAPLQEDVSQLFDEMKARVKEDDASVPYFYRGYWYYTRFETGAQYPIYARRKQSMDGTEEVLLDGNAMAKAAATVYFNIGASQVSPDGTKLLYAVDTVGRRQYTLMAKDIASGGDLGIKVESVTANVQWASDSETFFYTDDDEQTLLPYRLYRSTLSGAKGGAKPELVYEEKDSTFYLSIASTKSEKYLLVNSGSTLTSEIQVLPLDKPSESLRSFLPRERGHEYSLDHFNSRFYVRSNSNKASNFALYSAVEKLPSDPKTWRSELAHRTDALVEEFELFNDFIVVNERSGGLRKLRVMTARKRITSTPNY
jgi:oligopeptidase B